MSTTSVACLKHGVAWCPASSDKGEVKNKDEEILKIKEQLWSKTRANKLYYDQWQAERKKCCTLRLLNAKKDEEISDLKARLNIRPNLLENDNTVDGVERPQSSTQEPLPLVPAPQPTVVSDSESDDGDEETSASQSNIWT